MNRTFVCISIFLPIFFAISLGAGETTRSQKTPSSKETPIKQLKTDSSAYNNLSGSYKNESFMAAIPQLTKKNITTNKTTSKTLKKQNICTLSVEEEKMFSCDKILGKIKETAIKNYIARKKDFFKSTQDTLENLYSELKKAIKKSEKDVIETSQKKFLQFFKSLETKKIINQKQAITINNFSTYKDKESFCQNLLSSHIETYEKAEKKWLKKDFNDIPSSVISSHLEKTAELLGVNIPAELFEIIKKDHKKGLPLYRKYLSGKKLSENIIDQIVTFDDFENGENVLVETILNDQFRKN